MKPTEQYRIGSRMEYNKIYDLERFLQALRELDARGESFTFAEFLAALGSTSDSSTSNKTPLLRRLIQFEFITKLSDANNLAGISARYAVTDKTRTFVPYDEMIERNLRAAFAEVQSFGVMEAAAVIGCHSEIVGEALARMLRRGDVATAENTRGRSRWLRYTFRQSSDTHADGDNAEENSEYRIGCAVGTGAHILDDALPALRLLTRQCGTKTPFGVREYIRYLGTETAAVGRTHLLFLLRSGFVERVAWHGLNCGAQYVLTEKGLNAKTREERAEENLRAHFKHEPFRFGDALQLLGCEPLFLKITLRELVRNGILVRTRRSKRTGEFAGLMFPADSERHGTESSCGPCPRGSDIQTEARAISAIRALVARHGRDVTFTSATLQRYLQVQTDTSARRYAQYLRDRGFITEAGRAGRRGVYRYRVTSDGLTAPTYDERVEDAFRAMFKSGSFFTIERAVERLATDTMRVRNLVLSYFQRDLLVRFRYAPPNRPVRYYYSFALDSTIDDLLDQFEDGETDPVPLEERTTEPQLFGEIRQRYLELKARHEDERAREVGLPPLKGRRGRKSYEDHDREDAPPQAEAVLAFCRTTRHRVSFRRLMRSL